MLTAIDATPHNTLMENYNLSEKNKHKYSFDILAKTSSVEPLDSPPRMQMPAPRFVPPSLSTSTNQMPSSKSASNSLSSSSAPTSSTYIAPVVNPSPSTGNPTLSTSASSVQNSSLTSNAAVITSPTVPHSPILPRPSKDTLIKPMKTEKPTPPPIEKQNSTLENDLELSDSDDDRKKQNRSIMNSSDSSPSDSSESGSDSSRSETHQSATIPATHQLISQQQQIGSVIATKKKLGPGSSGSIAGSGSSSSGLGSSAPPSGGSSSSSSNKTPSPSNTTKWQLSRYFNKAPVHQTPTQDVVSPSTTSMVNTVNSMNVANFNMPITLRGGAQIIPEPPQHVANIKNEAIMDEVDDDDEDDENGNDMDNDNIRRRNRVTNKSDTFPHPAFPSRKAPAGLSVTPLSPMLGDIKKEISTPLVGMGVNQQQVPILNASEFVSIPSTQIKHEGMSIAGGHTTVTPYGGDVIEGLSNLSSDSNSSDDERLPVRGPGGTLQIPGVPAAITALPRSPPMVQKTQMLNSVTMIRLDSLNSSPSSHLTRPPPPQPRAKKPRKKLKQQSSASVAPDTSDEEQGELTKQRLVSPVPNVAVSGSISGTVTGPKKGRGRPRKTTPNQSGNISSTSSASASAKGPTLTAKKDINKKPASVTNVAGTARRRASRLYSSNSLAQDLNTSPTKQTLIPASPADLPLTQQLIPPVIPVKQQIVSFVASDDSSSSSDSSSCSISKSSSSASETEIEEKKLKKIVTNSSSSEVEETKLCKVNTKLTVEAEQKILPPKRIVKKLNTRKSSLEDLSAPLTSSNKSHNISMSSSSTSSSSESSAEDFSHLPNASTLTGGSSQQIMAITSVGNSSQRSASHQSPHKAPGAFFSESSGEDRSESDSGEVRKEKVRI